MTRPEVLAPAGSEQALQAAVRAGADAVYLGAGDFNARRNAQNFDDGALKSAVAYGHARGVRVYLALNTLVADEEMSAALELAQQACSVGVDGVIVQDLGLARLLRAAAPDLPLHASTQMSVHTPAGIRQLADLGFCRVVAAREMSLDELKALCAQAKKRNIEVEVFVQGALCMSVSGQCGMSSALGDRSANRGLCAQPCRLPFRVPGSKDHALSLKDLCLLDHLDSLCAMGVASLKIEGRMKGPEYVAAATHAYRAVLDKIKSPQELTAMLRAVFSRGGFTDGYLTGQKGPAMFGRRTDQDVADSRQAAAAVHALYRRERQAVAVSMTLRFDAQGATLEVIDGVCKAQARADYQGPLTGEWTHQQTQRRLSKCGGTPFILREFVMEGSPQGNLPLASVNAMKNQALRDLLHLRERPTPIAWMPQALIAAKRKADGFNGACNSNKIERMVAIPSEDSEITGRPAQDQLPLCAFFSSADQLPRDLSLLQAFQAVYLPMEETNEVFDRLLSLEVRVAADIPRALFGREQTAAARLNQLRQRGVFAAQASTLDGARMAAEAGLAIHAGPWMNLFNRQAVQSAREMGIHRATLSFEATQNQARRCRGILPTGVVAYGHMPLMLTRNCPRGGDCAGCGGRFELTDRLGVRFPVMCRLGCAEILNSRPLWMLDRLDALAVMDFALLWFTVESREECTSILTGHSATPAQFTRGLYSRGVR